MFHSQIWFSVVDVGFLRWSDAFVKVSRSCKMTLFSSCFETHKAHNARHWLMSGVRLSR